MLKVTFVTPDGREIVIENAIGTLMEVAIAHNIPGIDADCRGVCSCATYYHQSRRHHASFAKAESN